MPQASWQAAPAGHILRCLTGPAAVLHALGFVTFLAIVKHALSARLGGRLREATYKCEATVERLAHSSYSGNARSLCLFKGRWEAPALPNPRALGGTTNAKSAQV